MSGVPVVLRGGYITQLTPGPDPVNILKHIKTNEIPANNTEALFTRGRDISGAPKRRGIFKFPNPPISAGMTLIKIIKRACRVITELYRPPLFSKP
jgi:hypothetical protein